MAKYKHSKADLQFAADTSYSLAGMMEILGITKAGGNYANLKRKIDALGVNTSHFTGQSHNKGKAARARLTADQILVVRPEGSFKESTFRLRRALFEIGRPHECEKCGLGPEWNGLPLKMEIDHKNSDNLDNRRENLQFLCSNCHLQKTTGLW